MLDYETQRKLIIVFILATILVIIGAITALFFIWAPSSEKQQEEVFEVGKVTRTSVDEESVVKAYYQNFMIMFINNDIDSIYNLMSEDYLKYNEYDKEDISKYLIDKGVMGKGVELSQYESYSISGYSNVYKLDLKVKNEAYAVSIIIKEMSPNNYTIAFDNFIDYKENLQEEIINSIQLNIEKRIRYTNSVQYEFKLTNKYNKEVTINSGSKANPVILVNSQSEVRRPIMTTLSTAEFTMDSNESNSYTAIFNIEEQNDYIFYNTLVIKNIMFEGISGTSNLEYKLS